jgi:ubiquinone/menaquinone biosynthesis C-methylase UbiE
MKRIPEPELMEDPVQAHAYARADFDAPHSMFIEKFCEKFSAIDITGHVLDLGCGPADISVRFARKFTACKIHGLDGAASMLAEGKYRIEKEKLDQRIKLIQGTIPECILPLPVYEVIISNSLLHHLHDPMVLWEYIKRYSDGDSLVFIMDLMRPDCEEKVATLVNEYAKEEPEVLQRDFYSSLCAAFIPDEVKQQLQSIGLDKILVEILSDRHMLIYGNF